MIRKLSAIAIAAALAIGASGCSFNRTPETQQSYAPGDGVGADIGVSHGNIVKLRSVMYITNGKVGSLFGVIVNNGTTSHEITMQAKHPDGSVHTDVISVGAGKVYRINFDGNPAPNITSDKPVGATFEVAVKADNSPWQTMNVPVLDQTFEKFDPYFKSLDVPHSSKNSKSKKSGN